MLRTNSSTIEMLEPRQLLSSAIMAGGTLMVTGDARVGNTISVDFTADKSQVEVKISSTSPKGVTKNLDKLFPAAGITRIFVKGGAKSDAISVGQNNGPFNISTRIDAMAGNDTITTGAEADTINAGAGDDIVSSGDGNDIVRGGLGSDRLTVGNGNDKVDGGVGADVIVAGDGTDILSGGLGADTITAGNGNNTVFGGQGNDIITAGNGNNMLWGGQGNDVIHAGNGNDFFGGWLGANTLMGGDGHNTFYEKAHNTNTTNYDPAKDTLVSKGGSDAANPPTV